jgi:hypothetical protein
MGSSYDAVHSNYAQKRSADNCVFVCGIAESGNAAHSDGCVLFSFDIRFVVVLKFSK